MKNRNQNTFFTVLLYCTLSVFFVGCKEEGRIDHVDASGDAPAQITDVTVRNTPGGAVLKYVAPKDKSLLYVRALYEIRPGVEQETTASIYTDSLVLEGFGDTRTYEVKLYSVGKNGKSSEPLTETITPLTPPIRAATYMLREGFGGVSIDIENPYKANLAIVLMGDTANLGFQSFLHTFYTAREKAVYSYRGLDTVNYHFSVYLRDRWQNISDTIEATVKPIYEELIPKNTWRVEPLPTDTYIAVENNNVNYQPDKMWNDITTNANVMWASPHESPMPQWTTWDLGQTIILSRFKLWHRYNGNIAVGGWQSNDVRKFELYGTTTLNFDGSWDESWLPLGQFECVPPSGSAEPTNEDREIAARFGLDFELESNEFTTNPFVPVRWIRLKTTEVCMGPTTNAAVWINQITFWGQILKDQ